MSRGAEFWRTAFDAVRALFDALPSESERRALFYRIFPKWFLVLGFGLWIGFVGALWLFVGIVVTRMGSWLAIAGGASALVLSVVLVRYSRMLRART